MTVSILWLFLTVPWVGLQFACPELHVDVRASYDVTSGAVMHDVGVSSLLLLLCNLIIQKKEQT